MAQNQNNNNKPSISVNIVIVGASATGKTCLANQLVNVCFHFIALIISGKFSPSRKCSAKIIVPLWEWICSKAPWNSLIVLSP